MAYRLGTRIAGRVAGVSAALTLVLVHEFARRSAVGNAEGLMTALGLAAIDRHLDGRRFQAFGLGVAAALVRPEVWPFLLAYGIWVWARENRRARRAALVALGLLVPVLWFGGDWVGSGNPFMASDRALGFTPTVATLGDLPGLGVIALARQMFPAPAALAVLAALVWAVAVLVRPAGAAGLRSRREAILTVALADAAIVWIGIVALMAQRGYPGLPRFLFMALGLGAVVAGVGVARAAELAGWALGRIGTRPVRAAIAVAAVGCFAAFAAPDAGLLRDDAHALRTVAARDDSLEAAVRRFGGAEAVARCGRPYTGWFATTALAWDLGIGADEVHARVHGRWPVVFVLDEGLPGLGGFIPKRHVRVADDLGGWDVVYRCGRKT
jgi:hypothetical protein